MGGTRLLVVEDEFLIRLTLVESLDDEGFSSTEAATGDEALALLEQDESIALMLTDLQLPGSLDGVALARAARRLRPDLPIVFMSGRPEALEDFSDPARDATIAKPYLPSQVAAVVKRMLGL